MREADYPLPSTADIKNKWSYTSTTRCVLMPERETTLLFTLRTLPVRIAPLRVQVMSNLWLIRGMFVFSYIYVLLSS
jgi:hypothetical protein